MNETQEILDAFQPYYEQTSIAEQADPRQLYDLQARLDGCQVYYKAEVEEFARVFYKPKQRQTPADHAKMNACLDPAVARFGRLDEEKQEEFRKVLAAYRNLYAFLSQVIPFQDSDLEKLYSFGGGNMKLDFSPGWHYNTYSIRVSQQEVRECKRN